MSESFYVASDGQEFGPVSPVDVDRLLREGIIQPSDRIRSVDGPWTTIADWVTSRRIALTSTPQNPPVPPPTWWFDSPAGPVGPLTTDQFLDAVQSARITAESLVQVPGSREWIAAGTIPGLPFPEQSESPEPEIAPTTEREMRLLIAEYDLRHRSRQGRGQRAAPGADSERPTVSIQPLVRRLVTICDTMGSVITYILGMMLSPVLPLIQSRFAWILASAVAVIGGGVWFAAHWTTPSMALSKLEAIWQEYRHLKPAGVDSTDWLAFTVRAQRELAELTPKLARSARVEDRVSMQMLWISRDYLPQALGNPENASRTEEELEHHFGSIRKALDQRSSKVSSFDWLVPVIICLDMVVIVCLAWHFRGSIPFV